MIKIIKDFVTSFLWLIYSSIALFFAVLILSAWHIEPQVPALKQAQEKALRAKAAEKRLMLSQADLGKITAQYKTDFSLRESNELQDFSITQDEKGAVIEFVVFGDVDYQVEAKAKQLTIKLNNTYAEHSATVKFHTGDYAAMGYKLKQTDAHLNLIKKLPQPVIVKTSSEKINNGEAKRFIIKLRNV